MRFVWLLVLLAVAFSAGAIISYEYHLKTHEYKMAALINAAHEKNDKPKNSEQQSQAKDTAANDQTTQSLVAKDVAVSDSSTQSQPKGKCQAVNGSNVCSDLDAQIAMAVATDKIENHTNSQVLVAWIALSLTFFATLFAALTLIGIRDTFREQRRTNEITKEQVRALIEFKPISLRIEGDGVFFLLYLRNPSDTFASNLSALVVFDFGFWTKSTLDMFEVGIEPNSVWHRKRIKVANNLPEHLSEKDPLNGNLTVIIRWTDKFGEAHSIIKNIRCEAGLSSGRYSSGFSEYICLVNAENKMITGATPEPNSNKEPNNMFGRLKNI